MTLLSSYRVPRVLFLVAGLFLGAILIGVVADMASIAPPEATLLGNCLYLSFCAAVAALASIANQRWRFAHFARIASLFLAPLAFGHFLYVNSHVVWTAPTETQERQVMGNRFLDSVKKLQESKGWSDETVRRKAPNLDLRNVYPPESIQFNEWWLLLSWMGAVFFLLLAIGVHVMRTPSRDAEPTGAAVTRLGGALFRRLQGALSTYFNRSDLGLLVRTTFDQPLDRIIGPGSGNAMATELIEWAERNGGLVPLLQAMRSARAGEPKVVAVVDEILAVLSPSPPAAAPETKPPEGS